MFLQNVFLKKMTVLVISKKKRKMALHDSVCRANDAFGEVSQRQKGCELIDNLFFVTSNPYPSSLS